MRNQYKYEARMFKKKQRIEQGSLWVATHELSAPKTLPFYHALDAILSEMDFGNKVRQVFALLEQKLAEEDLITGTHRGIDTSVIEAKASLRELRQKTSGKKYRVYVKDQAKEDGVDTTDEHAVNRYDRKRKGKKFSNDEWEHPHDPDARIGRDKKGATRMLYKVEHVVDLDTNALIGVRILPGDEGDEEHPTDHVLDAEMRAAIVERSFAHTLESGGMRRSTLRGIESIGKRYQIAGFCVNLSLLLRKRFGFGTAKQCAATGTCAVFTVLDALNHTWISVILHFKFKLRSKSDFSHHDACNNITEVLCPRVIFT